jgi:hypothetical protein
MTLSDERCAEIAKWVQSRFPPPRIVVEREMLAPDETRVVEGPLVDTLYVHPEGYLALRRWADRQALLRL